MSGTSGMGTESRDVFKSVKDLSFWKTLRDFQAFAPGDVIIREGDPGDSMFIIKSGMVEVTLNDQLLDILAAGEIIGEMSLLDGSPRSATVTALNECNMICISREHFQTIATANTDFFTYCMKVVSARLRRMNEINSTLMRGPGASSASKAHQEVDAKVGRVMPERPKPQPSPQPNSRPEPRPAPTAEAKPEPKKPPRNTEIKWD